MFGSAAGLAGVFLYLDPQIPEAAEFRQVKLQTPLRVYASDGALIAEFGERRLIPISLNEVPEDFINALLDTEDKRFYEHNGIDYISLANDIIQLGANALGMDTSVGGASTITMQLARNVSFSLERRFLRKFKEMLLSLKIERELSKDEILELYINLVPFGKRAYGAEAAAMTYYGKSLRELNLPQLAMLAGIPQRPEAGNPINGPEWAQRRRNQVLSRMRAQNSITEAAYNEARNAPITAKVFARPLDVPSPYAAEWVRRQALPDIPDLYTGGYSIYTTLDSAMQREAIAALRRGLESYDRLHGYRGAEARLPEALLKQLPSAAMEPAATPLNTELTTAVVDILQNYADYGELVAAAVVKVDQASAAVLDKRGQTHELLLTDSRWARAYIDTDTRGSALKGLNDALAVGDIIRLRWDTGKERWLLSQSPDIQGALVALDPDTGGVKAIVGGYDFFANQYNHAIQAARQPGSGFKPFVYSAALANGVTPADIFLDAPLVFDDDNLESQYRPRNDNNRYNGPTRLREALYRSINLVSMRVLLEVGAGAVLRHADNFGFNIENFPRNTQLAIGGGTMAVAPIEMARAYAVFANGGYLIEPNIIDRIVAQDGTVVRANQAPLVCEDCSNDAAQTAAVRSALDRSTIQIDPLTNLFSRSSDQVGPQATRPNANRVLDESHAFIMNSMLRDVVQYGTGRRAKALKRRDIAGKTGTTDDAADTWFNGFHPQLVTSVWVGFTDQLPLGRNAYGSNVPLPIWIDFMGDALQDYPEVELPLPPGIVSLKVDPRTGKATAPMDPNGIFEYFLAENAPEMPDAVDLGNDSQDAEVKAIDLF
tara:strand:- start:2630 stop:5119 length:2490 start_codon:yes stop_codon:yes gene_type:complete